MTSRWLFRAPLLTLFALTAFALPVRAEDDTPDLPTAREVFDRYVEVTNASEMTEHTKRKLIGSFTVPAQGLSGNMTVWQKAPNLFYSEIELSGVGKIREGYDGEVAWTLNPLTGPQIFEGEALAQKLHQANYWAGLYRDEDIESAEVVEVTAFEGEPCYEVDVTRVGGQRSKEYFSVESGLMTGTAMEIVDPVGKFPARLGMSGYEDFDGMLVPTRTTITVMGMQQVLLTDDIVHDDFDESVFELPAEIAAMIQE